MNTPRLSVVMPVHQGARVLPTTLHALAASDLPRAQWELIVVDDGSTDGSDHLAARYADRVITVHHAPRGPAYARNRGAEVSNGEWVVFIDADVAVHTDTLTQFVRAIDGDPAAVAFFGSYDAAPPAPGFTSQYRNLLHHYTHLVGRGEAETFWAGCGAVRHAAFIAAGGFDEARYRRPQIEDIELGYRLRDRGGRIVNRPEIEGTHLKAWTITGGVKTDVRDRGVPWVRLLLERRALGSAATLNLGRGERLKTVLAGSGLLLSTVGALSSSLATALVGLAPLVAVVLTNREQFAWFRQRRGLQFAALAVPMNLLYYAVSGVSVVVALALHAIVGHTRRSPTVTLRPTDRRDPIASSFLPMHKAAFGIATGLVSAIVMFVATAITIFRDPNSENGIDLFAQYFAGYTVSWSGAFIGAAWAAFAGFVMGWFTAFARNAALGVLLVFVRTRAELVQTRNFLDHI